MESRLKGLLAAAPEVVFVCSGNMVRSAFAHLYAEHLGIPRRVLSLGTSYHNEAIYPETAQALAARGVAPGLVRAFRPTHLEQGLAGVDREAVLFAMRRHHLQPLGDHAQRAFLLMEVLGRVEEIGDPVLEGFDFEATFSQVATCVEALVEHLLGQDR